MFFELYFLKFKLLYNFFFEIRIIFETILLNFFKYLIIYLLES